MKTLILIILSFITLNAQVTRVIPFSSNPAPSGGCTLSVVDSSGGTSDGDNIGGGAAYVMVGNRIIPAVDYTLDASAIYIGSITGNVDSIDYVSEVFALNSTGYETLIQVGSTSNTKSGLSVGWNEFTFDSQIVLDDSATYGYVIRFRREDNSYNASHYGNLKYGTDNWNTGEAANYIDYYATGFASAFHATIEYKIRWSDCD